MTKYTTFCYAYYRLAPIHDPLYCLLVPAKSTEAVDDYLKAILELSGPAGERVTSNALAAHLEVRAASVTGMLQKLAEPAAIVCEIREASWSAC